MAEIFISYKSERRSAAEHLAAILRHYSYSVWFDYALIKGDDFDFQIDAEIRAAKAVIVLWCSMSVESHWVSREALLAASLKRLVPAKIENCELKVAHFTSDFVDLRDWDGNPRSKELVPLLRALGRLIGRTPQEDWVLLTEYEETWRRFGGPTLAEFALGKALVRPSQEDRVRIPSPPSRGSLREAEHEWKAHDLDNCDDPGLLKAYAAKWDIPDPLWAYKARSKASALETEDHRGEAKGYEGEPDRGSSDGRIFVDASILRNPNGKWFSPGEGKVEWFRDLDVGPDMVVVPAGNFIMGSPVSEARWSAYDGREEPQHKVTISRPFAVSRYCITRGEFSAFVQAKGHTMPDEALSHAYTFESGKWESGSTAEAGRGATRASLRKTSTQSCASIGAMPTPMPHGFRKELGDAIGSSRRQNGSIAAALPCRHPFGLVLRFLLPKPIMTETISTVMARRATTDRGPCRWTASRPIHGVFTRCTAMYGSGAKIIGTPITRPIRQSTGPYGTEAMKLFVYCVGGLGAVVRGFSGRLIAWVGAASSAM